MAKSMNDVINQAGGVPEGMTEISFKPELPNEGDEITGEYLGEGNPIEINSKPVKQYKVQDAEGRIRLIRGVAQIDTFFQTVSPGTRVWIKRGPEIKGGKGRVTTYRFATKR